MTHNYEVSEALINEAKQNAQAQPGQTWTTGELFLKEMKVKYKLPVKDIFAECLLDGGGEPKDAFKQNGWLTAVWYNGTLEKGHILKSFISPEAQNMLEYIFKSIDCNIIRDDKCQLNMTL